MSHAVSNLTLLTLAAALAVTLPLQALQRQSPSIASDAYADARSHAAADYIAKTVNSIGMQAR
jgi:hypothetical protein